jgi:uncharacterized membrane protein YbaN (DUF454 family)
MQVIGTILTVLWVVGFMNGYMVAMSFHFLLVLATVFISRSISRFRESSGSRPVHVQSVRWWTFFILQIGAGATSLRSDISIED